MHSSSVWHTPCSVVVSGRGRVVVCEQLTLQLCRVAAVLVLLLLLPAPMCHPSGGTYDLTYLLAAAMAQWPL